MKKILIGMLLISLLQANDSTISIQGNMNGDINKNGRDVINGNVTHNKNFNVELKLIKNQRYNTSITKNITTIIKQDPKLLKAFKKQFNSIGQQYVQLKNLNHKQKRLLKIIEVKLSYQNLLTKENRQILNSVLGTVKNLNITISYIQKVTESINFNTFQIIDLSRSIKTDTRQILHNQNTIIGKIEKNSKALEKIDTPNIIHDINWNLNSFCQEHNIKYIDEITFNMNKFNATNTLEYKHEREKINCLKTLYSKSREQDYEIHVFGSNSNDTNKVVEAIKLYGEIDERNIFQQVNYHTSGRLVYIKQVAR